MPDKDYSIPKLPDLAIPSPLESVWRAISGMGSLSDLMRLPYTFPSSESMPQPIAKPGPYITQLPPQQENAFQAWVKNNNIPFDPSATPDYDMRGFYRAMQAGDPNALRSAANQHFPDTWKTPYHQTFSNQSIYATPDAPHWVGNRLFDVSGRLLVDETPTPTLQNLMK
jgi:hypothetical protein